MILEISSLTGSLSQPEAAVLSKNSYNAQTGLFNGSLKCTGFNPTASTSSQRPLESASNQTFLGPAFDDEKKPTSTNPPIALPFSLPTRSSSVASVHSSSITLKLVEAWIFQLDLISTDSPECRRG